jgi:hypothetical protein
VQPLHFGKLLPTCWSALLHSEALPGISSAHGQPTAHLPTLPGQPLSGGSA